MAGKADPKEAERQKAMVKYDDIKKFFLRKDVMEQLNAVIPKVANADRLLRIALGVLRQNEGLMKCSQASILAGIVQSLQMGLSLDPALKEAHLVPFWNDKKKMYEATFIPDYRGYLSLARRAGDVASVSAHPVYKSDHFIIRYGTDKILEHIPNEDRPDNDPIRGAYIVYYFKDGGMEFDYMPWKDIEKRMKVSKAPTGPWKEWTEEMATKTVIRHSIKQVGISSDLARAAELEERTITGESQLDMLPLLDVPGAPGEEVGIPETVGPTYDELVAKSILPAEITLWNRFVGETATNNRKSVDETKERMKADFPKALSIYESWKAKEKAKQEKGQPEPATKPPETPQAKSKAGETPPPPPVREENQKGKPETKPGELFESAKGPSTAQPPGDPPPPTQTTMVLCPNTQDQRSLEFCKEKCPYNEGCPAYEAAGEMAGQV